MGMRKTDNHTVVGNAKSIDASNFYKDLVALDLVVFDITNYQRNLNYMSGIYCFFDGLGNPLYVGKTNNFITRIRTHLTNSSSVVYQIQEIVKFVGVLPVEDSSSNLLNLERRVIMEIKPLFNGAPQGPFKQYGYKNLRAWVDESQQEYRGKVGSGKTLIISKGELEAEIACYEAEYGVIRRYVGNIQKYFTSHTEANIVPVDFGNLAGTIQNEKSPCTEIETQDSSHSKTIGIDKTEVKRELIKQIIQNFNKSERLDVVLDAILEL